MEEVECSDTIKPEGTSYSKEIEEDKLKIYLEDDINNGKILIKLEDKSTLISSIYENKELDYEHFNKTKNIFENIHEVFLGLKQLFDDDKFTIKKKEKDEYILTFSIENFMHKKTNLEISLPRQLFDPKEEIEQIKSGINKLEEKIKNIEEIEQIKSAVSKFEIKIKDIEEKYHSDVNNLENKIKEIEENYQNNSFKQNEKLDIKPNFTHKDKENQISIELIIIDEILVINFIENKNIINDKYSTKLSLEDFYKKNEYFKGKKNIQEILTFINTAFEKKNVLFLKTIKIINLF